VAGILCVKQWIGAFLYVEIPVAMTFFKQTFKEVIDFFYQIFLNRHLLFTLSMRDFQKKYVRNFFGLIWAILDPLAFVLILYVVLGVRYGDKDPNAIPFVVYLLTGYIVFEFFSSSIMSVTTSIKDHSFLLNKVNFRVAILPIVTILSNLTVHLIVLALCIVVLLFHHIYPSFYWLQVFYYMFALSVFLVSAGWLTSSIFLFFPDIRNILSIMTRIMFFVTPIFWKMEGLPPSSQFILKLNPIYYIVNGYRDSLLNHRVFWESPLVTLYFWSVCLVFLVAGVAVFKKLRPHFADVV
jgi:ABC-type polysaccharide/polyol phosphate export permease